MYVSVCVYAQIHTYMEMCVCACECVGMGMLIINIFNIKIILQVINTLDDYVF